MANPARGNIRAYESELDIFKWIVDGALIALTLPLASLLYKQAWSEKYTLLAIAAVIIFYVTAKINNLYTSSRYRLLTQEITPLLVAWFSVISGLLLLGYMLRITEDYSRVVLGLWFVGVPIVLVLWRYVLKTSLGYFRSKGFNIRRVVIIGDGTCAQRLANSIRHMSWTGLRLQGFITQNEKRRGGDHLGGMNTLYRMIERGEVDVVYIAMPMNQHRLINDILDALSDTTVTIFLAPDLDFNGIEQGRWVNIGQTPTVSIVSSHIFGSNAWIKRMEDILVATAAIILTAPLMLLIAIAIKLDSSGPVFYKQKRYGLNGKEIAVWKFRSMKVVERDQEFRQAQRDDDRITAVGKRLRNTSLDEFPQFFNVLTGDMSIVGPRPHAVAHNEEYRGLIRGYMQRHIIKPGMTGLAQIKGFRGETETREKMEQRVKYDMEYINNWSVWLDLKIILLTPIILIKGDNAY
jgi:putative colanic acid biosynthesis UDP-glucose lipid carrier transferase